MDINDIPHSRGNAIKFFKALTDTRRDTLRGKKVYDLSAGSGYIANLFYECGSNVKALDLFPEHNQFKHLDTGKIDLSKDFDIGDSMADIVILSETFEHLPDQYHFFKEVSRILDKKGLFILTTPNPSSLRSRFSQFVTESEHYSNPLPDETNAYVQWPGTGNGYFNKIFISGILRIRVLAAINGLKIKTIHQSEVTSTSVLLMIFYPLIWFFSLKNYRKQIKEHIENKHIYKQIYDINTSVKILLSKHLIIEFEKNEVNN